MKQRNHHEFKSKRMLISEEEFLNLNKEKEIEQHAMIVQTLNNQSTVGFSQERNSIEEMNISRLMNKLKPLLCKRR